MCDSDDGNGLVPYTGLTRRRFNALAATGTAASIAGVAHAQARKVVGRAVNVPTPDGLADSMVFYPAGPGQWPGVLIWSDIMGRRPAVDDIGKRLASSGYVALVVNPYYRSTKSPVVSSGNDIQIPAAREKLMRFRAAMGGGEGAVRDTRAFMSYLEKMPQTSKAKMGVHGYCMGGELSFLSAAALPDRIGAVGCFHASGLTTDKPDSPHLYIPKSNPNARYLVAVAQNDDAKQPNSKTILWETFAKADRPAVVDVFHAEHGWCVPDGSVYNEAEAERAWAYLLSMYKATLV